jgi:hypothetical protein
MTIVCVAGDKVRMEIVAVQRPFGCSDHLLWLRARRVTRTASSNSSSENGFCAALYRSISFFSSLMAIINNDRYPSDISQYLFTTPTLGSRRKRLNLGMRTGSGHDDLMRNQINVALLQRHEKK